MHLFVVCQHIVIMVCIDTINLHYFNLYQFTKTWYHYDSEKSQWQDEETGTLVLTINTSSADRYTIKDKDDNKLVFDASGKLTKMQDASGNTLTVTYNGIRVTKVTDGQAGQHHRHRPERTERDHPLQHPREPCICL